MSLRPRLRRLGVLSAALAAAALVALPLAAPAGANAARPQWRPPKIGHVFVIVLENEGYAATFGSPKADPYLARTLPSRGALLTHYYGTGHESNDNYVAMVSGQAPNPQNQGDCQVYSDFAGSGPEVAPGQAVGQGCVFPATVPTIGNQLSKAHLSWKAYMGDMGNDPSREGPVCAHPQLNSQDETQSAVKGDGYVTRHDPFVYFHSIIDDQAYCDAHVVPLGSPKGALPANVPAGTTGLSRDLRSIRTTPRFSFIVPNVCDDGHDYPCSNEPSGKSAFSDIDRFLEVWVPKITSSAAFEKDGLLAIVFDEASTSDATSCCGEQAGPNSPMPGITGMGGGRTGAVLLSPFIAPGTVSTTPYNHYSLLASIESELGLARLGYASDIKAIFGKDVFKR